MITYNKDSSFLVLLLLVAMNFACGGGGGGSGVDSGPESIVKSSKDIRESSSFNSSTSLYRQGEDITAKATFIISGLSKSLNRFSTSNIEVKYYINDGERAIGENGKEVQVSTLGLDSGQYTIIAKLFIDFKEVDSMDLGSFTLHLNTSPNADAGIDQAVSEGDIVTLNGSSSLDADGDALTFLWTQTSGANVTLSSNTSVNSTFTAPSSLGTIEFNLLVNDGIADSSLDSITITIQASNVPPIVIEENDRVVDEIEENDQVVDEIEENDQVVDEIEENDQVVDQGAVVTLDPSESNNTTKEEGVISDQGTVVTSDPSESDAAAKEEDIIDDGPEAYYVSNQNELISVLTKIKNEATVYLEPGNYGVLSFYGLRDSYAKYSETVTIRSKYANDPAIVYNLGLREVSHLRFEDILFKYEFDGNLGYNYLPFKARECQNISFVNCQFIGDKVEEGEDILDGNILGYATGYGLSIRDSKDVVVDSCEFSTFLRGIISGPAENLQLTKNNIHSMRSDGINCSQVQNVVIEGNYIHDFEGADSSGDHMDMIQFWTKGSDLASANITIRNNFLHSGFANETQSIFMRNEIVDSGGGGLDMYYQNILIENNIIHNAHSHGISVGESNGLVIRKNTLIYNRDSSQFSSVSIPGIRIDGPSLGVEYYDNASERYYVDARAELVRDTNNFTFQTHSPRKEHYVGWLYSDARAGGNAILESFKPIPDHLVAALGAGSNLVISEATSSEPTGYLLSTYSLGVGLKTHQFDASNQFDEFGQIPSAQLEVQWDFGDGNTGVGLKPEHTFQTVGYYNIEAHVKDTLSNRSWVLKKSVLVETPIVLSVKFNDSAEDQSEIVNILDTIGSPMVILGAARLPNYKDVFLYKQTKDMIDNPNFSVSFSYKKDSGAEETIGHAVYFSGTSVISVKADSISFVGSTDLGEKIRIDSGPLNIKDDLWHHVTYTYSQGSGEAILYVDGTEVNCKSRFFGKQHTTTNAPFYVGSPFGQTFTGVIDDVEFVSYTKSAVEISQDHKRKE